MKKSKRDSNVELLKILAIFMIICSHIMPFCYLEYGNEYINIEKKQYVKENYYDFNSDLGEVIENRSY